jgi:hypothetical protein
MDRLLAALRRAPPPARLLSLDPSLSLCARAATNGTVPREQSNTGHWVFFFIGQLSCRGGIWKLRKSPFLARDECGSTTTMTTDGAFKELRCTVNVREGWPR